jgi:4-hydroxy-3-polyprenylbenzoate decarboxylase
MYRVQIAGNEYESDREVGLHYQIHRGIGVHHQAALARGESLPVSISVGGSPAMTLSAVMPLPEGMTELMFAGALSGRRIRMLDVDHAPVYADADFAIVGTIDPQMMKPEGPFGDHLGYYSLTHPYPVVRVRHVWHREGAIWPFTIVGRPPQEDTTLGQLIHELTDPIIPTVIHGVRAVHAVDASGVHPLLLAIGSERYTPYLTTHAPQELLTQANAILGTGQLSLAKYLWITDDPHSRLDIHDVQSFLMHMLRRVDWRRDLHFQTRTTIDTLDYSGSGIHQGSKLVIAATGPAIRELASEIPSQLSLAPDFASPRVVFPGVLAIRASKCNRPEDRDRLREFCRSHEGLQHWDGFALVVLVDEPEFVSQSLRNWLWVTFTRSNPAIDVDGMRASVVDKHWGCEGPLVIDARIKPHHAPPVIEDPQVNAKVDALASRGGPVARYL